MSTYSNGTNLENFTQGENSSIIQPHSTLWDQTQLRDNNKYDCQHFSQKKFEQEYMCKFEPSCLHDICKSCKGTGVTTSGRPCIHNISCPCSKCTPSY